MAKLKVILRFIRARRVRYFNDLRIVRDFIISWIVGSSIYSFISYLILEEVNFTLYTPHEWMIYSISVGFVIGLFNGIFEIVLFNRLFNKMKFVFVVLNKTLFFFIAFMFTVAFYILFKNYVLIPVGITLSKELDDFVEVFQSAIVMRHALVGLIINFMINFFMQVKRKMGKGVLLNLFLGRYHRPRREERIVMFLDLTSATAIAEKLDLYKYSSFLKDFFYDIDDAINETKGAIFQFVGDEVVILWHPKDGSENNNCINFFFKAQKVIHDHKSAYLNKYGVFPEFKAGLHFGTVVITEVGGSKQEIAYHGDTINTTARIRSTCNKYKECLLVSAELLSRLNDLDKSYSIESVGVANFKGKANVVGLFRIRPK